MPSLTKSLLEKLKLRERDAEAELIAIAKREATNKAADGDVTTLEEALRLTGKGVEQYQAMVALLQRIKQLEGEAAKLPAASAADLKARSAIAAHKAETVRIEKERKEDLLQLEQARNANHSKQNMYVKAQCELERLQYSHPELFGGKAVDLDAVTLTSGDRSNTIFWNDDAAPSKEVPMEVWQEQSLPSSFF